MSCPGDLLSGLVDGELDHATRNRVQTHLLGCTPCRREVEVLRALKAQLSFAQVETPLPPDELTARLMAMVVPGMDPAARSAPVTVRPVSVRPRGRAAPTRRQRRARRGAAGGAFVLAGLTAAFWLGGPASARETSVPLDPGTDAFVVDYLSTTADVARPALTGATVVGTGP